MVRTELRVTSTRMSKMYVHGVDESKLLSLGQQREPQSGSDLVMSHEGISVKTRHQTRLDWGHGKFGVYTVPQHPPAMQHCCTVHRNAEAAMLVIIAK